MPHQPASATIHIRVLDLTRIYARPQPVRQLADWIADVIDQQPESLGPMAHLKQLLTSVGS